MSSLCARYGLTHTLPEGFHSVSRLGEGAFFGEQSFMCEQPALSSVITLTYVELMLLRRESFNLVLAEYPSLAIHVEGHKREMALEYHAQAVRRQRESQAAHLAA